MRLFVLERHPEVSEVPAVTDFLYADNSSMGEAPRCPVCEKYVGMLPLLPPIRVELETWEADFGDFAFGTGDELLISEAFRNLYHASGLKGPIYLGPAEVVKVKSHQKAERSNTALSLLPYRSQQSRR